MSHIQLVNDGLLESTSVSNLFIDYYMKEANDAQIKVYLYLLRKTSTNASFDIGDIAEEFNHTEKDVIRALKYWEKAGLLNLQYDLTGEICRISLANVSGQKKPETAVREDVVKVPVLSIVPNTEQRKTESGNETAKDNSKELLKDSKETKKSSVPEKPSYSAGDLRTFREEPATDELIAVTESYLMKPLSPSDLRSLLYIHKELNFDFEMMDLLLQYCVSKNKKSFNYIEAVAVSWFEQGITTPKQAKDGISKYDRNIFDIMAALGKNSTPTIKEVEFINRWLGSYSFSKEMVLAACERTVMKTDSDRFAYAEGILSRWKEQGLYTLQQVENSEAEFKKKRDSSAQNTPHSRKATFQKTKYDFAALQKFINES